MPFLGSSELISEMFKSHMKLGSVTIVHETSVTPMWRFDPQCVFNWAPILFGPTGNLPHIGDQAIGVTAILAIELFDRIQICQVPPVEMDVIRSTDALDTPDRKAYDLE